MRKNVLAMAVARGAVVAGSAAMAQEARSKSGFRQDFTFPNPANTKIEPKQVYCEKTPDELVVCGGIYKPM